MVVSITENQIAQVNDYIEYIKNVYKNKHPDRQIDTQRIFYGKCAEIAFGNYGQNNKLFCNAYGLDLYKSILKKTDKPDTGIDYVMQSLIRKCLRANVQIKLIMSDRGHNLCLRKYNDFGQLQYDSQLNYYTGEIQDIFVLIRYLSTSTYDILGYIRKEDAIKCYTEDFPVKNCYCINEKYLEPIETISDIFKDPFR